MEICLERNYQYPCSVQTRLHCVRDTINT